MPLFDRRVVFGPTSDGVWWIRRTTGRDAGDRAPASPWNVDVLIDRGWLALRYRLCLPLVGATARPRGVLLPLVLDHGRRHRRGRRRELVAINPADDLEHRIFDPAKLAVAVLLSRDLVDAMQREIEDEVIVTIARRQPMAIDLRQLVRAFPSGLTPQATA